MHGRVSRVLQWLASPRWMLAFFGFATISALISMERPEWVTPVWIVPLSVFALSLVAAILTNPRFRNDLPLLGLHLGLLAFIILLVFARLTYLEGAVSLSRGSTFNGQLNVHEKGPLHFGNLANIRFTNDGFEETFRPGERWEMTANRVRWLDAMGREHQATIGDHRPLVFNGYHIYTTRHRGFTVGFLWEDEQGHEEIGTVQLRYGDHDLANEWVLGGQTVWAMLQPQESIKLKPGDVRRNHGAQSLPHALVIRQGETRYVITRGERVKLPGGWLTYRNLDAWMGYRLVFDPAMHWLGAAGVFVVFCMIIFYGRQFFPRREISQ